MLARYLARRRSRLRVREADISPERPAQRAPLTTLAPEIPLLTRFRRLSFTLIAASRDRTASRFRPRFRHSGRLCYLYLETLTLTYAWRYNGWRKEPSWFLSEMGPPIKQAGT